MSHHKRSFIALLILWMLSSMILSLGQTQAQPVFRIGVIDGERGPISNGARLAVEQINAAGGVQGAEGTLFQLELVTQGPASDGSIVNAVANLGNSGVIAVLGPMDTDTTLNNLAILQNLNVPVLTTAIGDTILASDSTGRLFRSRATEFLQGRALATYIAEDLQYSSLVTVQLDIASTAAIVGFSTAASALGIAPTRNFLFEEGMTVADLARDIAGSNPQVAVVYGAPDVAAGLFRELRLIGWSGVYSYSQAENDTFRALIPLLDDLVGIVGTTTWSTGYGDLNSQQFILDFVGAYGEAPGAIEAAAYDSVQLIAIALGRPGTLDANLASLEDVEGVQGVLRPSQLARGEISDNVGVIRLGNLGGPQVVARFASGTRLPLEGGEAGGGGVLEPTATPTLDGVYVKIVSAVQNVRSGPSTDFEILGQLQRDAMERVIGANLSFTWVVIDYRGLQGWLAVDPTLNEILGDRRTVPVVAEPPTPTPNPQDLTPPPSEQADIVVLSASPSEFPINTTTNVTITIRNAGLQNAGNFAVAASFAPLNIYSAQNIAGLAAGAQQTFTLSITTGNQTGNFEAVIVADLNNEVNEGSGEANNQSFVHKYRIDRPSITSSQTMVVGSAIDLDANGIADVNLSATGLNTNSGCTGTNYCIGILSPALTWETAHYDAITSGSGINGTSIATVSLTQGTVMGVLTDTGRRVVMRVDSISPGSSMVVTYRLY